MNSDGSKHKKEPPTALSVNNYTAHSILVMDDEEMIRVIAASMLKSLGYSTTTCANGDEAIELYSSAKESGDSYLAVVMDLTIQGGMGGKDAAKQILLVDPKAKLIVSSGYSDDPVVADHKSFGFCLSLPKPYRVADMAAVLAALHSL